MPAQTCSTLQLLLQHRSLHRSCFLIPHTTNLSIPHKATPCVDQAQPAASVPTLLHREGELPNALMAEAVALPPSRTGTAPSRDRGCGSPTLTHPASRPAWLNPPAHGAPRPDPLSSGDATPPLGLGPHRGTGRPPARKAPARSPPGKARGRRGPRPGPGSVPSRSRSPLPTPGAPARL